MSFKTWLFGYPRHSPTIEDAERRALHAEAARRVKGTLLDRQPVDVMFAIVQTILDDLDASRVSPAIVTQIDRIVVTLYREEPLFRLPELDAARPDVAQAVALRHQLRKQIEFLADADAWLGGWRNLLAQAIVPIIENLPPAPPEGAPQDALSAPLVELVRSPARLIQLAVLTFFARDTETERFDLFRPIKDRLTRNIQLASGIIPGKPSSKPFIYPADARGKTPTELVETYLAGTPIAELFLTPVPFAIPLETRFEHTHILAAQGHGKTQTLQHLITQDLLSPTPPSMVIIDSQGQMIEKIQRLELFRPDHGALSHRLIIIDPKDDVPPALNVFDINQRRMAQYGPQMREQVLNGVLELYTYLFGSLRADLTQQQSTIFRAFARLMLTVPDANLGTLYELLVDHKPFLPYIEKLGEPSRSFFLNDFVLPAFNPTRQQIRRRLFDLLDNYTLKRMLSAPRNRLNMFEALNTGKIVVVNTSKEFFKAEQSAFFGRFFIALALQAIEERAGTPERHWHPVMIYVDEAQEYFDDQIAKIITELRKYNCSLVFCHHDLSQLPQTIRSAAARCAIQMIGGAIDADARALASDLRTTSQFSLDQKRDPQRPPSYTEYACYVRNQTEHAVSIRVPFYTLENQPVMDDLAHRILRQVNRHMVGVLPDGIMESERSADTRTKAPRSAQPAPSEEPTITLQDPDLPSRPEENRPSLAELQKRLDDARYSARTARHDHDWQQLRALEDKIIPALEAQLAQIQKKYDDLASDEY